LWLTKEGKPIQKMNVLDNKISFISGFVFTALSTVTIMGVAQAAVVGLVGGFFGLLGKELFYYLKGKINGRKST